jgi:hypothetical protein
MERIMDMSVVSRGGTEKVKTSGSGGSVAGHTLSRVRTHKKALASLKKEEWKV